MKSSHLYPQNPVLLVDDETESLRSLAMALRMQGISHVAECSDSRQVALMLAERPYDVLVLDLTMPHVSGEEILTLAGEQHPDLPVIVVTAVDAVEMAVRCMRKGALDYMVKPVEKIRLVSGVRRAIELRELRSQARLLRERMLSGDLLNPGAFAPILTRNKAMLSIFQYMESIAPSRQPVLITGETGVGKELMVKALHALTDPESPLVSVNVAGLDDNVFADTLFGHCKGAFTGATEKRRGLVEKAAKGILHLDEIGDLNHESQIKLLRLLQEGEYFPLGSDTARLADTRVVATTNRDLARLQGAGQFRNDLYYRLSVHHIQVPPLRQRRDDIPLLLHHGVAEAARALDREPPAVSDEALALLAQYDWPGNIRELKTMVHDAVSRNRKGRLSVQDFSGRIGKPGASLTGGAAQSGSAGVWLPFGAEDRLPTIEEATLLLIREALRRCGNNQSEAARLLGVSRQRLARHARKPEES